MKTNLVRNRLCQHFRSIGLKSHEAARFSSLVAKWIDRSGPEWTVKRLKALGETHKQVLATNSHDYSVPTGWAKRVNRKGKTVFRDGLIHRIMTSPREGRQLELAQSFFRAFQVVELDKVTEAQLTKFEKAVETPLPQTQQFETTASELERFILNSWKLPSSLKKETPTFTPLIFQYGRKPGKRSPIFDTSFDCHSYVHESPTEMDAHIRTHTRDIPEILTIAPLANDREWVDFIVRGNHIARVNECLTGSKDAPGYYSSPKGMGPDWDFPNGTIGFVQEPGAKLRSVANPFLCIQALGEPLKQRLAHICQMRREISVFNQQTGRTRVAGWLATGHECHGFDASAFTDRLPYRIQRAILTRLKREGVVDDFDIGVMDIVVSKSWRLPTYIHRRKGDRIKWEAGQPQGYGPSFFLATLTHDAIAQHAVSKQPEYQGKVRHRDLFVIVGDDICWRSPPAARQYVRTMTDLGVEINLEKSLISKEFAEFCGKIITVDGPRNSMKVRRYKTKPQLLKNLEFYGRKGLWHLSNKELRWAYHVILPRELGGQSWSPEGLKYAEYLAMLDMVKVQKHLLQKQLSEFLEPESPQTVETRLNQLSEAYRYLSPLGSEVGATEVEILHHLGRRLDDGSEDVVISEWTGFPVTRGVTTAPDKDGRLITVSASRGLSDFSKLIDNMTRQALASDRVDMSKLPADLSVYLSDSGYVRPEEPKAEPSIKGSIKPKIEEHLDDKVKREREAQLAKEQEKRSARFVKYGSRREIAKRLREERNERQQASEKREPKRRKPSSDSSYEPDF